MMEQQQLLRREIIPARGYLGLEVARGQILRIIDVEGKQNADVVLIRRDDTEERLSAAYTRSVNGNWRIGPGHTLYSWRCQPMAVITADTVGRHFCSGAFCSEELNFARYGVHGTPNCFDNLVAAIAPWGLVRRHITHDSCSSFFMNVDLVPEGQYKILEPVSQPGDYLDLTMAMDCIVAISACPQDRNPCNGWNPTSLEIQVLAG